MEGPTSEADIIHTNNQEPELVEGFRPVALHRVVGMDRPFFKEGIEISPRDATGAFEHHKELLNEDRDAWPSTIEKTPEQKAITKMVIDSLPAFLKLYGLEKPVLIPETAIQIFDMSGLPEDERKRRYSTTAHWSSEYQIVRFNGDALVTKNNLDFAKILAHELIHAHSFSSLEVFEVENEDGKIKRGARARRSGLINYSSEKDNESKNVGVDNFAQLNEGVTEALAQHFINTFLDKIPYVDKGVEKIENEIRQIYEREKKKTPNKAICVEDNVTGLTVGDDYNVNDSIKIIQDSGAYWLEVKKLKEAVKMAFNKSKEYQEEFARTGEIIVKESLHTLLMSFHEELDVTTFITKAYFSGKQLDFARLVEFVSGRTFREVGESTNLIKKRFPEKFE